MKKWCGYGASQGHASVTRPLRRTCPEPVIYRVLVEMFSNRIVAEQAAFHGGAALQRSKSLPKGIDPVQKKPGPVDRRPRKPGRGLENPRKKTRERFLPLQSDTSFSPLPGRYDIGEPKEHPPRADEKLTEAMTERVYRFL